MRRRAFYNVSRLDDGYALLRRTPLSVAPNDGMPAELTIPRSSSHLVPGQRVTLILETE